MFYNWTMVTTVAMFGKYDPELMCFAHSKGARVVLKGTELTASSSSWKSTSQHEFECQTSAYCARRLKAERCCSPWLDAGDVPLSSIVDPLHRRAWIADKVHLAKAQFMDGINLDIEQAVESESPEFYALTKLVNETTEAFHREIPGSQVKSRCKVIRLQFATMTRP